jgi:hypothetical protein
MREDELRSIHIAVYALSLLGGAHQKIHTEEIAEKCLELAPDRFKWERRPYPDKELVRKALFHASEKRNGSLVTGRAGIEQRGKSRDGWQLTPEGAAWLRENESRLATHGAQGAEAIPRREAERFLKKIQAESAYRTFLASGNLEAVSQYMFTDLLGCSPDAPLDTIRLKFERILATARLVNDEEVLRFLDLCGARFGTLLRPGATQIGGGKEAT